MTYRNELLVCGLSAAVEITDGRNADLSHEPYFVEHERTVRAEL
jgi:hypothetical protein